MNEPTSMPQDWKILLAQHRDFTRQQVGEPIAWLLGTAAYADLSEYLRTTVGFDAAPSFVTEGNGEESLPIIVSFEVNAHHVSAVARARDFTQVHGLSAEAFQPQLRPTATSPVSYAGDSGSTPEAATPSDPLPAASAADVSAPPLDEAQTTAAPSSLVPSGAASGEESDLEALRKSYVEETSKAMIKDAASLKPDPVHPAPVRKRRAKRKRITALEKAEALTGAAS